MEEMGSALGVHHLLALPRINRHQEKPPRPPSQRMVKRTEGHTGPEKGSGAIKNKEGDGSPSGHVHNDNGLSGQHPQGPRKTLDGLWLQLMSAFSMEN